MPVTPQRQTADELLPWQYSKPGQLRQEYFVDDALRVATVPRNVILAQTRPPVPQVLMPPRFGYPQGELTIEDVLATDRFAPKWRSWFSGAPAIQRDDDDGGISSGLRNVNTEGPHG